MDYLELIKSFWNKKIQVPHTALSVYFFLLHQWDLAGKKRITVSDRIISKELKISRRTVISSRNILKEVGLIRFDAKAGYHTEIEIVADVSVTPVINTSTPILPPSIIQIQKAEAQKQAQRIEATQPAPSPVTPDPPPVVTITTPIVKAPEPAPVIEPMITPVPVQKKEKKEEKPNPPVSAVPVQNKGKTPTLDEFMAFAKTVEIYNPSMDYALKSKYETWNANGWVNGFGKPILNWKLSLKNTMPHLGQQQSIFNVPKINRPKTTYNE